MKKRANIFRYVIFGLFVIVLVYLTFTLESDKGYHIDVIELEGNLMLSSDQYFRFAKLKNKNDEDELTLSLIKDRIEKHPYINKAEVRYDGNNKVLVKIEEKSIEAIIYDGTEQFLITESFELLPIVPFTKQIDYPVLTNPMLPRKIVAGNYLRNYDDVFTGFQIIEALKLAGPGLYDQLSEIDLRNGGDIILTFSDINFPVVIGRQNEIEKVIYFNTLWKTTDGQNLNFVLDYVDLRYNGLMYLGFMQNESEEENSI